MRQHNLAPQLRQRPLGSAASTPAPAEDRTPEAVRDRMAAYRDGWVRGGGRPPGRGPGDPGPGMGDLGPGRGPGDLGTGGPGGSGRPGDSSEGDPA
ncbi:hypothetical protein [Streptomyces fragilis]|uniref:Uncharacterized protein n=1 Tax=Streptomyces fragilis TaxID=67301 RepID=A0ABV2YNR3_9ACTN|nr:hypothetical protein [Streptomyces fragilis]